MKVGRAKLSSKLRDEVVDALSPAERGLKKMQEVEVRGLWLLQLNAETWCKWQHTCIFFSSF